MASADFLVVGGGIAGLSAGYELAQFGRVKVLEREAHLGYHATGRSAAVWLESAGNETVQRLTRATASFFNSPPAHFADSPLVRLRGALFIANNESVDELRSRYDTLTRRGIRVERVDAQSARERVPALRESYVTEATYEPDAKDIDVDLLLQSYVRGLRARGGEIVRTSEVTSLRYENGLWLADSSTGRHIAKVLINAAGAWADHIAGLAGTQPLELVPMRRTAVIFDASPHPEAGHWPAVADAAEQFYFKPEAGRLLASPADETPDTPSDAAPDDFDVALVVDRIQRATDLAIPRIEHRFAGLRTFAPDRAPVIGYDPHAPGFFWLAGQGGFGVQSAPAAARIAASLAAHERWPADLQELGVVPAAISPARFHL